MSSGNDFRRLDQRVGDHPGVERTPRPGAGGIPVPEREEVLTAPEGILAPHVTDEAARRAGIASALVDERGTE